MREKTIQKAVVSYAKEEYDAIAIKLSTLGGYGTSGWPDYLFVLPRAQHFYIEFKATGEESTPLQLARQDQLRKQGCHVYVCDDSTVGKEIIDKEFWRRR